MQKQFGFPGIYIYIYTYMLYTYVDTCLLYTVYKDHILDNLCGIWKKKVALGSYKALNLLQSETNLSRTALQRFKKTLPLPEVLGLRRPLTSRHPNEHSPGGTRER